MELMNESVVGKKHHSSHNSLIGTTYCSFDVSIFLQSEADASRIETAKLTIEKFSKTFPDKLGFLQCILHDSNVKFIFAYATT